MSYVVTARALQWREPSDHPQDDEEAALIAEGIGGRYSIHAPIPVTANLMPHTKPGELVNIGGIPHFKAALWWPHDEFTFNTFDSIEEAKLAAEADWQRRFREHVASPASVDTHPQGGDATQIAAPFMSGAVPCADTADAQITPGDSNG